MAAALAGGGNIGVPAGAVGRAKMPPVPRGAIGATMPAAVSMVPADPLLALADRPAQVNSMAAAAASLIAGQWSCQVGGGFS